MPPLGDKDVQRLVMESLAYGPRYKGEVNNVVCEQAGRWVTPTQVGRAINRLMREKLVVEQRDQYRLTSDGEQRVQGLRDRD